MGDFISIQMLIAPTTKHCYDEIKRLEVKNSFVEYIPVSICSYLQFCHSVVWLLSDSQGSLIRPSTSCILFAEIPSPKQDNRSQ